MKPAPFDYHAPTELEEVLALLSEHGDEAKPLAGGQSLVPILALRLSRFEHLVDINRVSSLSGIDQVDEHVAVGATTRQAAAHRDMTLAGSVPLLPEAIGLIGHFQTRNRGTVGGSLAHADPTSELAATALALDAQIDVASASGRRTVSADELLDSAWTTTLEPDELIVSMRFPVAAARSGQAIREISRRHGDFAIAGAVAAVALAEDGEIADARVVTFAVAERARRATRAEQALTGAAPADVDLASVGRLAVEGLVATEDVQATATYRKSAVQVLVENVVAAALSRAEKGARGA